MDDLTKVLVVDDDVQLRRALVRSLRANGFDTRYAGGYDEALQAVRYQSFDVVLTDLVMPGMEGTELVHRIHQRDPDQDVVVVTGRGETVAGVCR